MGKNRERQRTSWWKATCSRMIVGTHSRTSVALWKFGRKEQLIHLISIMEWWDLWWTTSGNFFRYTCNVWTHSTVMSEVSRCLRSPAIHDPTTHLIILCHTSLSWPKVSTSLKFCKRFLTYAAPPLWNELSKYLCQITHTLLLPVNLSTPAYPVSLTRNWKPNFSSYLILVWSCTTQQPPSPNDFHCSTIPSPWHELPRFSPEPKWTKQPVTC